LSKARAIGANVFVYGSLLVWMMFIEVWYSGVSQVRGIMCWVLISGEVNHKT
jgi:hypothetical protein